MTVVTYVELRLKVAVRSRTIEDADKALYDISREVLRVANRKVLRKRFSVAVGTESFPHVVPVDPWAE